MNSAFKNIAFLISVIFTLVEGNLFAQNYSITPNDTIIGEVPFNDIYHFNIQQNNLISENLYFNWELVTLSVPEGWAANLCDNAACYEGFPLNGTMNTVFVGEYGLMSVGINPGIIEGTAFIQYLIWEESTPGSIDTLTWIIKAENTTAINSVDNQIENWVYPNPAGNQITINTELNGGFNFLIRDLSGKIIIGGNSAVPVIIISTEHIPNGIYLISLIESNHAIRTEKLIITN